MDPEGTRTTRALSRLPRGTMGAAPPHLLVAGLVIFIIMALVFLIAPAFFLALIVILIGGGVLLVYRMHPWGLPIGALLVVLGLALAFFAQGQGLSLALVPHH